MQQVMFPPIPGGKSAAPMPPTPMSLATLVCLCATTTMAAPASDLVTNLPGFGAPPTPHYSGFLNASASEPGTYLHYWLATSSSDKCSSSPGACPTVLWLNGGPGASSIMGMLQEQGPLIIDASGSLMKNPHAWTNLGNLLVVESPAGVGYSYCAAQRAGTGACHNTDVSSAKALHAALRDFFQKFSELQAAPFFITGESYAGVYCPTLAAEIVNGNAGGAAPRINLVGMAVGDPCTDNDSQRQSMDMLWYAHKNSLVTDDVYTFLTTECGATHPSPLAAGSWVARRAAVGSSAPSRVVPRARGGLRLGAAAASSPNCTAAMRRYLLSSSSGVSQEWELAFINELSLYSPRAEFRFDIPGSLNYRTAQWMMRSDVRKALHVDGAPAKAWPGPADGWTYDSNYAACNDAAPAGADSMIDFYRRLAPQLPGKIVVYNGDTDPCVSYEGTRVAIEKVGFATRQPYRPWFFNATASSADFLARKDLLFGPSLSMVAGGAQFGGEIVDYEHGLSFATVHGSGHMVPTFRPRSALQLLEHVVYGSEFAPEVPSDAALAGMSEAEFSKFLDMWVVEAESVDFVRRQG